MNVRFRLLLAAAAIVALALGVSVTGPALAKPASEKAPKTYVALGDSFASGPLIPVQEGDPYGCLRSSNNYAHLLARATGVILTDVTCSGGRTKHMTEPQSTSYGTNPPQFDAITAETDLVSLQIGGNDIGFSGIAQTCGRAALEGSNCRSKFQGADGGDALRDRIADAAGDVRAAIEGIRTRTRSPEAEVFVLGYPGIFSHQEPAGCPAMLVGEGDAQYLRGIQIALNEMIEAQAIAAGATYVDLYGPSNGKTGCDLPVIRWVEPIVVTNAAAPIHPNLTGMQGMAVVLETAMGNSLYKGPKLATRR
ncbi:MAG: SGNH/GDSL hydrolase family protein [Acidimicrobiales bacterium]